MKRFVQAQQEEETQIDITPMLDVVFIMLIFFIVTASFVKEVGLDVIKPEPSQANESEDNRPIVVEINNQDEIRIDTRRVDKRSIKPTIVRMMAERPDSAIIVQAHKLSTTKAVVEAVDGIRAATGPAARAPVISVKND
jgi:biopolymer transport protein ExbD